MNKIYGILILLQLLSCNEYENVDKTKVKFDQTEHDFGNVQHKKEVVCQFSFSNVGEKTLIISDVKPSCGCTMVEWTKAPLRPGQTGIIQAKYTTSFTGVFDKEITVYANCESSPITLRMRGNVQGSDSLHKGLK